MLTKKQWFFTIEKFSDAIHFEKVEVKNGGGNSNSEIEYSITDFQFNRNKNCLLKFKTNRLWWTNKVFKFFCNSMPRW